MESTQNNRIGLIATLPKSGTWYAKTVLWCYGEWSRTGKRPDLIEALKVKRRFGLTPAAFNLDELHIGHAVCPGFSYIDDPKKSDWDRLVFPIPYDDTGERLAAKSPPAALDPAKNSGLRVCYFFRNPLDHFVSLFRHTQSHVLEQYRMRTLPDGRQVPITSLHEFIFEFGALSAFIKHYYTFRQMQRLFPKQVMLMPYEELMQNPFGSFSRVLAFMGTDTDQEILSQSLAMCSKEALALVENQLGRSLANDQKKGEKHIRDGKTGKWREHFSQEELAMIEAALGTFNISLRDFELGKGGPLDIMPSAQARERVLPLLYPHSHRPFGRRQHPLLA